MNGATVSVHPVQVSPPPVAPPEDAMPGERRVWHLDGPCGSDRKFRRSVLQSLPAAFGEEIAEGYRELWQSDGRRAANLTLLRIRDRLAGIRPQVLARGYTDEDLRGLAHRKAANNSRRTLAPRDPLRLYGGLSEDAFRSGVEPPRVGVQGVTLWGALKRLSDEQWWRRALRKTTGRALEAAARDAGLVHRHAAPYVSRGTLERCRAQHSRNSALLECIEVSNELGDSFTLADLRERSVANPKNRRHELMCRLAGFETIADERGEVGEFVTLTCPRRYHCRRSRDGRPVEAYSGATPRDGQEYLTKLWARIRSTLHRRGIKPYGMRMAEPNHDGTPHWHMVLFVKRAHRATLRRVIREYALQEDGDEPGAQKHRVTFEAIDRSRGSAVSYAAKYVSKGIDGAGLDAETEGIAPDEKAQRIKAWAGVWGIRQFQQIGGPSVTVWRELRRAAASLPAEELERARSAADSGDWAEFVRAMGGPNAATAARPVRLAKEWSDEPGKYGEPRGDRTFGVEAGPVTVVTREHTWEFRYRPEEPGPVPEAGDPIQLSQPSAAATGRALDPWSSVNNYTARRLLIVTSTHLPCSQNGVARIIPDHALLRVPQAPNSIRSPRHARIRLRTPPPLI